MRIIHFIPQSEFICNNDGKIMVDFIGRFENLNEDLKTLREDKQRNCIRTS